MSHNNNGPYPPQGHGLSGDSVNTSEAPVGVNNNPPSEDSIYLVKSTINLSGDRGWSQCTFQNVSKESFTRLWINVEVTDTFGNSLSDSFSRKVRYFVTKDLESKAGDIFQVGSAKYTNGFDSTHGLDLPNTMGEVPRFIERSKPPPTGIHRMVHFSDTDDNEPWLVDKLDGKILSASIMVMETFKSTQRCDNCKVRNSSDCTRTLTLNVSTQGQVEFSDTTTPGAEQLSCDYCADCSLSTQTKDNVALDVALVLARLNNRHTKGLQCCEFKW